MNEKMKCKICGYIYYAEKGEPRSDVNPGTSWEDVPDKFRCPSCGVLKTWFISL